ncbi:D-alanyl-D-alanine carboxypeptidase, serine-type, PBP4 family [Pseudarthrobacter phenanthrenivorans Sphe3]|uniref:D-alanyl-D-alanine carboxypeptidase, serine-type, PBP4 family n=1 Tax=Pseudarthrobacter phenanthrenivorans (strain DSM 18606 / JCM 16027 / LMG 23796 / Sphe3) TaxID=930171 RepID=F0M7U9_PSEPM|nr:D-alanyl-D-alanine carboxypeptidase/D-alanyl-D-alanine-endopeptidase [Pseudarthrobacter phenanthrenivorans]ADX71502.1 D-alanyl-D-alanine carboxypeptidase, serine-type, PBP4 family [Pseudarthrobacter phenanthrenivorans Sphe3]
MTKATGRDQRLRHIREAAARGATALKGSWPGILLASLLAVLAIPSVALVAPGFLGPEPPASAPPPPAWQQAPASPSARLGLETPRPSAAIPAEAAVTAQLEPLLKADGGGNFTGLVQDALTGQVLFDRGGSENRVPASNLKLLTAIAALRALGPDHRFTTKAVAGPNPGQVVLVGGGDVLLGPGESNPEQTLGRAGLATLAAQTVAALQAEGRAGEIKVLVDDSLFTGPALNPAWESGDVAAGEVAPLYPLALNSARFDPAVTTGPRPQDAAITAAEEFAARLRTAGAAAGLTVAAAVERSPGPAQAAGGDSSGRDTSGGDKSGGDTEEPAVLAEVQSATVAEQVNLMLQDSDNYLAEALGRLAALAGGLPGSNDGATAAVRSQLGEAGLVTDGLKLVDVCGLAMGNQVPARQFSEAVRAITSGPDIRLRAALDGFPVAGLTGTLDTRYGGGATAGGAGLVRAKTGTLNTVIALSGYVVDADGRLLVFSFIGNGLTPGAAGNKEALDRAATALAGCGCR